MLNIKKFICQYNVINTYIYIYKGFCFDALWLLNFGAYD